MAALVLAGCSGPSKSAAAKAPSAVASKVSDPGKGVAADPNYSATCAPSGPDSSLVCLEVTLQAIDDARAKEGLGPMALPADLPELSPPRQLLAVLDAERVDRGLPPIAGVSDDLSETAAQGASSARLPPEPGAGFAGPETEWIGATANALDADYQWVYDDGPGSGLGDCRRSGDSGCWADRHVVLDDYRGAGTLVLGAAFDPTADNSRGDQGGTSLAAIVALDTRPAPTLSYTWAQVGTDLQAGAIRPRSSPPTNVSATQIPDPAHTVPADPDFTQVCDATRIDDSAPCLDAVLAAVDHARAAEGVKALALPSGFARLSVPEQIFVAINLERVDRGLRPFAGLTAALDHNAQLGADRANDPPDPGSAYDVVDTEWAGGSANGLDAVYGLMYDDGPGSGNLDCPKPTSKGCWGHRHGILDNFGTVGTMVMGAALNPTGDNNKGDKGGTSMAATLAVTSRSADAFVFSWSQVAGASGDGSS